MFVGGWVLINRLHSDMLQAGMNDYYDSMASELKKAN